MCEQEQKCKNYQHISCDDISHGHEQPLCFLLKDEATRKAKAFDWLEEHADELSFEFTGTHYHIFSGLEGKLTRLGRGRTLLDAIEDYY